MDMFSMIKHSLVLDGINPILKHFTIVKQVASAGPEMVWKIYEARRIKDEKVSGVFHQPILTCILNDLRG